MANKRCSTRLVTKETARLLWTHFLRMAENLLFGKDYENLKPSDYLKDRYDDPDRKYYRCLRCYHEVFQSLPSGLTVLDYGTGPVIVTTISAFTKASEIVLSDYAGNNREALRQWLDRHPDAFDWSLFFRRVTLRERARRRWRRGRS